MMLALLQSVAFGDISVSGFDVDGLVILVLAITAVVHIGFAVAVHGDARAVQDDPQRRLFAAPALWSLATLLGGVFTAAIYWLIHRSPLGHDAPLNQPKND